MTYQIDQSQKIEQTSQDTILGISNGKSATVLIPARIKRKLQSDFRVIDKPRLFVYRTFVAGIVLLIKYAEISMSRTTLIIIDTEYEGKEKLLTRPDKILRYGELKRLACR